MIKIIETIKNIFGFIETLFNIIMSIFETIGMIFNYIITTVQVAFTTIANFPSWITSFMIITIAISIGYIIIGRNVGKSD